MSDFDAAQYLSIEAVVGQDRVCVFLAFLLAGFRLDAGQDGPETNAVRIKQKVFDARQNQATDAGLPCFYIWLAIPSLEQLENTACRRRPGSLNVNAQQLRHISTEP